MKSIPSMTIEQQRERERQRFREDEERRKRFFNRKDHPQPITNTSVPKFEQLAIDSTHEDPPTSNKTKAPLPGMHISPPMLFTTIFSFE